MLVALGSNIVDLIEEACLSPEHIDAMEATAPPPPFRAMSPRQEAEVFACYWLLALAPAWRSTAYTFSDTLYQEVSQAPRAGSLLRIALDVLVREAQEPQYRQPDASRRPPSAAVEAVGLQPADATHVADAIGLGCHYFLTDDRRIRNRSTDLEAHWQLSVRRPSEFLAEAVRAGAPWTTQAPWPWESTERIGAGNASSGIGATVTGGPSTSCGGLR